MQHPFKRQQTTNYKLRMNRGVTLIDTLVGSALMLVVFLGVGAAFQLSIDVVTNNKARAGAITLANDRMEYLKSLSYDQIGVTGGIPAGIVPQTETQVLNSISYTRRTLVLYSDDPLDGLGASDTNAITADYKTIRVEVSWESRQGERSVSLIGRVSPIGVETAVPGGTLTISVVNASSTALSNAEVRVQNTSTSPEIDITSYSNENGIVSFIGSPAASEYQITVTKSGYSTAQTYTVSAQNPNPNPRHLSVSNNQTTSAAFAIDVLATKRVETYKQIVPLSWDDPFADGSLVSTSTNISISSGEAHLTGPAPYADNGELWSSVIQPSILAGWNDVSWVDRTPASTDIRYSVYNATGGTDTIISDSVLSGNTTGFTTSPIDLSALSTSTYQALKIRALFSTSDTATTSALQSWAVSYDYGPEPLPNFTFTMRGSKTIGNSPTVYKYDQYLTSAVDASIAIPTIEWDTYTIGVTSSSTYEIAEACAPQPQTVLPGENQTTRVYLLPATSHSLLVDVRDSAGSLVQDATVNLTRTGYDVSSSSSSCGQAFFAGLTSTTYSVTVTKSGYQVNTTTDFSIIGDTRLSIVLQSL